VCGCISALVTYLHRTQGKFTFFLNGDDDGGGGGKYVSVCILINSTLHEKQNIL